MPVIQFALPAAAMICSEQSTDSTERQLSLSASERGRLNADVKRIVDLAGRNPFAAMIVIEIAETVLKFFDA